MDCIKKKVNEEIAAGWKGSDLSCEYHPCHFKGQDCTFCYCPFYPCEDEDLGSFIVGRRGEKIWSCTECLLIHRTEACRFLMSEVKRLGIENAEDSRLRGLFPEFKRRFFKIGRATMVVGATSDAGKSVTVAAICRILMRRGVLCSPFKSQNMSLNSKVTRNGSEIAMIQTLQAQAAGLTAPDHHMNPILLKPKADTTSQVIVCGKPFADYDVEHYYGEFVPGPGREIVKEHVDFLKRHYDMVIMEGAGSPAEINIYDKDIANMRAAEIADANVILVVNVEWGGSFAYAVGTVELIPEEDRRRIKGIILNNVRGDPERMRSGADRLEEVLGIPVIGIIPHADVVLPSEDSEALRGKTGSGEGNAVIGVVRFPRIANFTDLDPLALEDVRIRYVESPADLEGVDAVILPGTKNTVRDYLWMVERGIRDKVVSLKGKVPILGICGGYQMMGTVLDDSKAFEGGTSQVLDGLGFFDMDTVFGEYSKKISNDTGRLLAGDGGTVTGYELHMGMSESREKPLFELDRMFAKVLPTDGSYREEDMTFGTYLHGCLDTPAFRKYFLSFIKGIKTESGSEVADYTSVLEENLDKLADVFEANMDIDRLMAILEGRA
ncbi:MAG: cobyric acid synthase [Candidatus Methanomethylophilaceae archaeon]|nr:cobyric acid synthase [Candidatus Methanomethylophilaceae archaeon]